MIEDVIKEADGRMDHAVQHLVTELQSIRTGRANPALIERVMVPYYGTPTPLNQLAQISTPEARLLVVQVYDRGQMGAVEKAIRDSGQGLNPANDGQVIRVPIPPLTEDRRKEYVKMVRGKAEEARVAIRNVRRDEIHRLQHVDGITEDLVKRGQDQLQKLTDQHVQKVDQVASRKEAEVMEV